MPTTSSRILSAHSVSWMAFGVTLLLSGCATRDLKGPIGSLQTSLTNTATTLGGFYGELNKLERELYLSNAAWSGSEVFWQEKGQPTALQGQFSPTAIRARLDALALLAAWAEKLAAVAGSESPSQINTSITGLGTAFAGLPGTFTQLAGSDNPDFRTSSLQYVGPVTALIGTLSETSLSTERDLAVKKAIIDGHPFVKSILELLLNDVQTLEKVQLSGLKLLFAEQVSHYNLRRTEMSIPQRQAALDDLKGLVERYELLNTNSPMQLLIAVQGANQALLVFAESPRNAGDIAALATKMSTLSRQAKTAADAMIALQVLEMK